MDRHGVFLFALLIASSATGAPLEPLSEAQRRLGVPTSVARVTDASPLAESGIPDFVLIQDVHQHAEVQSEIASVLLYARRHWPVRTVFVEGAFSQIDLSAAVQGKSAGSPGTWIREGRLSGPEMAALMSNGELRLTGLEDIDLYRANLRAYDAVMRDQDAAARELDGLRLVATSLDLQNARYPEQDLALMNRLVRLRLKPSEIAEYRSAPVPRPHSPALRRTIEKAEIFYQLADERSRVFIDRAERESAEGPKVLVVGGFHTALMAEMLREAGRSYAVLTPRVTQPGDERSYRERMRESVSALKLPQD
jgi:hypothetical protein